MKNYQLSDDKRKQLSALHRGEISIILGEDAYTNLHASITHSESLAVSKNYDAVYYLNLPFSRRRFTEASQKVFTRPEAKQKITCRHIDDGYALQAARSLRQTFESHDASRTAIIINSWELTSMNYQYREALIFTLIYLAFNKGVSIFIYSTANPDKVEAGKSNRTGLGKLSLAAETIVSLSDENADVLETVDDTTAETEREEEESTTELLVVESEESPEIINLSTNNIKDLAATNGHLSKRQLRKLTHKNFRKRVSEPVAA